MSISTSTRTVEIVTQGITGGTGQISPHKGAGNTARKWSPACAPGKRWAPSFDRSPDFRYRSSEAVAKRLAPTSAVILCAAARSGGCHHWKQRTPAFRIHRVYHRRNSGHGHGARSSRVLRGMRHCRLIGPNCPGIITPERGKGRHHAGVHPQARAASELISRSGYAHLRGGASS